MKGGLLQPAIICNTLFDTGANPFNYTYLYFINRIKSQVPIDIYMIDEPVYLRQMQVIRKMLSVALVYCLI